MSEKPYNRILMWDVVTAIYLLGAFPATRISLNVQSEDKAVAWSRSKPKNTMKAAFGHTSPPASRISGSEANFLDLCRSKRSISATILFLDNRWFVGCEVVERGRLALLHMLFYSKSSFDRCWWVETVLARPIHRSRSLLELGALESKNGSSV